jgi:hypothetical protein
MRAVFQSLFWVRNQIGGQVALAVLLGICLVGPVVAQEDDSENASKADDAPDIEMVTSELLIVDPDGNPVEEATVYCTGMRTKIKPGSHWGWTEEEHGPLPKLKTNEKGIVAMPVPKFVTEKLVTGAMTWTVEHPDFVPFREDRNVVDPTEIKLQRGFKIAVTAVNAETGEKIKDNLYGVAGGSRADWKLKNSGMLVSPTFAAKATTVRICCFVEGQPALFSKAIKIEPGDKSRVLLKDVELKIGTRVEGKLDDSIERPIENGYVAAGTVENISQESGWRRPWSWNDKVPINADGTFVFESLPTDEVLQMIPICDGWVPSLPEKVDVLKFFPDQANKIGNGFALPQLVKLEGEKVTTELRMEKATTLDITIEDPDGQPIPEAKVMMWPNQLWFNLGSQILGTAYSSREVMVGNRAGGYEYDREMRFAGTTNKQGVVTIRNLPAGTESIAVQHKEYEPPISEQDSRSQSVDLKLDEPNVITIKMEKKGSSELGDVKDDKEEDEKK